MKCHNIVVCSRIILLTLAGVPSPPQNFTHVPDYRAANDTHVVVNLMWAAAPEVDRDGVSVEYTIIITDLSRSITTNTSTTNTTFTSLQFHVPHLITLYTSTCGHTLISDNFTTIITSSKLVFLLQLITHNYSLTFQVIASLLLWSLVWRSSPLGKE